MTVSRNAVMAEAVRWCGTPYRHQGSTLGIGCDCLGLVRGMWRSLYKAEPPSPPAYARDWLSPSPDDLLTAAAETHFRRSERAIPGDLLLFAWQPGSVCSHVGILMPENRFVHAYERAGVVSSALVPSWKRRIRAAYRFPESLAG